MAKTKSSKFQDSRTFTCSVPAEVVQAPGDYEYKISVFNDYYWENTRYHYTKKIRFNSIIESNYPIFFYDGLDDGIICGYDDPYGQANPRCMFSVSKIVLFEDAGRPHGTISGSIAANYKGPVFRASVGKESGSWITDNSGSISLRGATGEVRNCKTYVFRGRQANPPTSSAIQTWDWDYSSVYLGNYDYIPLSGHLFNGTREPVGQIVETASYYIGNLNNPTYNSYADWQAACREMERRNNG